jgi:hypothetical protein
MSNGQKSGYKKWNDNVGIGNGTVKGKTKPLIFSWLDPAPEGA